jgi:hypothetical protein
MPAAVGLFGNLDSPISRRFLTRFTTQDDLDWLSPKRLATWLASASYSGHTSAQTLHTRITAAPAAPRAPTARSWPGSPAPTWPPWDAITSQIRALSSQISDA